MNRPASPPTRWRERADRVRDAALEPLARQLGYRPDSRNPARWKLPGSVLSISGSRFQAARQWPDCASDGTRGRAAPTSARRAIEARRAERRFLTGWSARAASGMPVAAQADLGNARMHERVGIAAFSCSVPDIQEVDAKEHPATLMGNDGPACRCERISPQSSPRFPDTGRSLPPGGAIVT